MNQNHFIMKYSTCLLVCAGLFLASCSHDPSSSAGIPFKPVSTDTAKMMILRYLKPQPGVDTSFGEVPKVLSLDPVTMRTFAEKNKEGEVEEIRIILAAYLDSNRLAGLKNTYLLQIHRSDKKYYYYDLRVQWDPKTNSIRPLGNDPKDKVCPLPADCIPPGL